MKKLLGAIALISMSASAQIVDVEAITEISTGFPAIRAVVSPDGETIVAASPEDTWLRAVAVADGKVQTISDNGMIRDLQFTPDSREIIYISGSTDANHLTYKEVRRAGVKGGNDRQMAKPSRRLNGISNKCIVVDNKTVSTGSTQPEKMAYIYYGQLMLTDGTRAIPLNPNGREGESYLWPSVSPDGTKVLYYRSCDGTYVCDIDGRNAKYIGEISAPRWVDNETVIGMRDIDDGTTITESTIVMATLDGRSQDLTDPSLLGVFPTTNASGDTIVFTTADGHLYKMKISKK